MYRSFTRDAARPDALSRFSLGRDQTLTEKSWISRADFSFDKDQSYAVPVKEQVDSEKFPVLARLPASNCPETSRTISASSSQMSSASPDVDATRGGEEREERRRLSENET